MYTVGDMVRVLQSMDPNSSVDELLLNSTFTTQLRNVVNSWPERSKKTARKILQQPRRFERRSFPSEEALRAIRRTKSIALPASLTVIYNEWQRHPSTFWNSQGFEIGSRNIYQAYRGMKQLETQRHSGTIIWRFFAVFFYDLMSLLGEGRKYLVEKLQDKLVHAIDVSCLVDTSKLTIQTDLRRWASAGSKYCNIVKTLGNGALILLPQDVTDNVWENRLPMKGLCFEEAMEHLESLGIREVSKNTGADKLGGVIREIIIRPFRELGRDQSYQEDLSKISSAPGRGIESPLVESEDLGAPRLYQYDSRHSLRKGCQTGDSNEHGVLSGQLSTPLSTEWTEASLINCGAEKYNESDAITDGQAQETYELGFDVGNYPNFMATLDSSAVLEGIAEDGCAIEDLLQFDVW